MTSLGSRLKSLRSRMPEELFWYSMMVQTTQAADYSAMNRLNGEFFPEIQRIRRIITDSLQDEIDQ